MSLRLPPPKNLGPVSASIEADEAFDQRREARLSQLPCLHNGAKVLALWHGGVGNHQETIKKGMNETFGTDFSLVDNRGEEA